MRGSKQRSGAVAGFLLPIGLVCLFALCSLALALLGGRAYKNVQDNMDSSFGSSIAATYLRTKLSQNNMANGISVREEDGTQLLVLSSEVGGDAYETRIYFADGRLMESTSFADMPFSPSGADILIAQLSQCSFSLDDTGLFTAEIVGTDGDATRTAFALLGGGSA